MQPRWLSMEHNTALCWIIIRTPIRECRKTGRVGGLITRADSHGGALKGQNAANEGYKTGENASLRRPFWIPSNLPLLSTSQHPRLLPPLKAMRRLGAMTEMKEEAKALDLCSIGRCSATKDRGNTWEGGRKGKYSIETEREVANSDWASVMFLTEKFHV